VCIRIIFAMDAYARRYVFYHANDYESPTGVRRGHVLADRADNLCPALWNGIGTWFGYGVQLHRPRTTGLPKRADTAPFYAHYMPSLRDEP